MIKIRSAERIHADAKKVWETMFADATDRGLDYAIRRGNVFGPLPSIPLLSPAGVRWAVVWEAASCDGKLDVEIVGVAENALFNGPREGSRRPLFVAGPQERYLAGEMFYVERTRIPKDVPRDQ